MKTGLRLSPAGLLLVSHALAATAMSMPWPALLAAVRLETGGEAWVGAVAALRLAPYVLLSAMAGLLADGRSRARVIRRSSVARLVLLVGCALALADGSTSAAVALAVLVVAAGTPSYPAAVAAMPGLAGARAGRLTDLLVTAEVTTFVVGPALGGVLLGAGLVRWTGPVAVVMMLAAVVVLRGVVTPAVPRVPSSADSAGRLQTVLAAPGAVAAIAVVALVNFVESAAAVGLLALSHERWGSGDRGFGLATAAFGFGSLAAPLFGLLVRLRGSLLLTSGGLAAAGLAPAVGPAVVPLVVAGAAGTTVECCSTAVLQRSVPDHVRAFSLGLADAVLVLGAMLGSLVVPLLLALGGATATLVVLAAVSTLGLLAVRASQRAAVHQVGGDVSGGRVGDSSVP